MPVMEAGVVVVVAGAGAGDAGEALVPEPHPNRSPPPRPARDCWRPVRGRPLPGPVHRRSHRRRLPASAAPEGGAAWATALEEVDRGPVPGGAPGEIPSSAAISCASSLSIPRAQMPTPRAPSLVTSCDTS